MLVTSFLDPPLQEALVPVTVALVVMLVSGNKRTARIATRIQEFFFCSLLLYFQRFWSVTVIFSIYVFIPNSP